MKNVFVVIVNMLLFFFLADVLGNIMNIADGTLFGKILVGLIFGVVIMLIPNILKFFKLPVTNASSFLLGIIVTFAFFLIANMAKLITISTGSLSFGIAFLPPISLPNATMTIVFLSILATALSIGLEMLNKKK